MPGILGAEPAAAGPGLTDVLAGDLLAADPDLPGGAGGHRLLVGSADLHLDRGQRAAHRREPVPHVRVGAGQGLAMVIGGEQGDGRAGLGQPVGVHEIDLGQRPKRPLHQLGRHAPAAVGEMAQRRQVVALERGQHAAKHGGHHHGVGDLLVAGGAHPGLGLERGEVDDAASRVERAQHGRNAGDVVRRDADQLGLGGVTAEEVHRTEDVRDEVPVPQHRRLGLTGGATGEEQHRHVVGVDRREFGLRTARCGHLGQLGSGRSRTPVHRRPTFRRAWTSSERQ